MATSLLDNLHLTLDDLERRVQAYRHDRVLDFQRHYHSLLRDVAPSTVADVDRALIPTLIQYTALRPVLDSSGSPPMAGSITSPPSQTPHSTNATSDTAARSSTEPSTDPHEREIEFQGLFTPTYLPLLDGSVASRQSPSPPVVPSPGLLPLPPPPESSLEHQEVGVMDIPTRNNDGAQNRVGGGAQSPSRPSHARRSTADTNSSAASDVSDTKSLRSALRRSSSTSRPPQSPRRVRFEFMGAEVLPTASPQPSEMLTPRPPSPVASTGSSMADSILGADEDDAPPPRKISSSDALRALSRTPLEEDTVWTVVNSDVDESPDEKSATPQSPAKQSLGPRPSLLQPSKAQKSQEIPMGEQSTSRTSSSNNTDAWRPGSPDEAEESDSSDEDFLSMGGSKSLGKARDTNVDATMSRPTTQKIPAPSDTTTVDRNGSSRVDSTPVDDSDDEELFHFEASGLSAPPRTRPKPLPIHEESLGDEPEDEIVKDTNSSPNTQQASLYATSPAVTISRRRPSSGPSTPTSNRFQPGSIGSYKGRPVVMPVVRNQEVHDEAASLGDFNTFVGGLDGRSGMDEGDMSSFRASMVPYELTGTPKSLTERMMMEEAAGQRMSPG